MSGWLRGAKRTLAGLKPLRVPEAPARAFRDLWPGDAARGQRLLKGEFEVLGTTSTQAKADAYWRFGSMFMGTLWDVFVRPRMEK